MNLIRWKKILKMLLVFFILAMFTACSGSDSDKNDGSQLIPSNDDTSEATLEQHECWQKSLLDTFYDTLGAQTQSVYNAFTSENVFGVITLAFGIWMAYQILRHVATSSPEAIGEFWTKIIRKAFLCVLCGILASSTTQLYYAINTFIFPIYLTILEYGSDVLKIMGNDPDANIKGIKIIGSLGEDDEGFICEEYSHSINDSGCSLNAKATDFNGQNFPQEPKNMMGCMACAVSDRLGVGYNIAIRLFKLPGLSPSIAGGFLMVCFSIAKLGFAFYLVDSIFRLNMMMIILPFLILFYPFEQTRKWTITGFQLILNSSAIMMCLAVIVSMTILAMQKILLDTEMGFAEKEYYESFSTTALSMIFMGFAVIKCTTMAVSLSGKVTGGGGSANFQKKVKQLVATVARAIFTIFTFGSGKAVTTAVDYVKRVRALQQKIHKAKAKANNIRNKINAAAGRR